MIRMSKAIPAYGTGSETMGCAEYTSDQTLGGSGSTIGIERDICNTFEDPGGAGGSVRAYFNQVDHLWYAGTDGPGDMVGPPEDLSVYHKFGVRTTSDGSSDIQTCYYVDDVQYVCGSDGTAGWPFNARQFATLQLSDSPDVLDEFVQYVRVYSCSSFATQQCNGTIVTAP
jgi:hypothetical protein